MMLLHSRKDAETYAGHRGGVGGKAAGNGNSHALL